ncbi:MAG TPA: MBL fold metallo-hydrolase, partial [Pseudoalteromonas sp.]|nr:MBL fold metallo-hydrolase [Pseudoalteromonas sp.]
MTLKPLLVTVIPALFITLSLFSHSSKAAVTWQQINENVQFLKQQDKLRFYDSNQVLIEGEQCALMVDASGNFAAVEALAKLLKKHLKTPLCY